jgi:hypothetical protein
MAYQLPPDEADKDDAGDLERISAPFTAEQMTALEKWQRWGMGAKARCPTHRNGELVAVSTDGFRCTADGCTHTQDWAYAFVLPVKYCTKDEPHPDLSDPKDYVVHVDARETDPDCEGEIIPFHCPNCGRDFDVDYR